MVRPGSINTPLPLIVVAGPTASGKSDLALEIACATGGEIISCDSVQVYRGFDIGSAKASAAERSRVPHHLIDCCAPEEQFHAARFRDEALSVIAELGSRSVQPVLAGGTTLYLSALLSGLSDFPESDGVLRQQLQSLPAAERYELLRQRDPDRAAQLHPHDTVRSVRALEIVHQTGAPVAQQKGSRQEQDCPALVINLCVENEVLAERIARRTAVMLDSGLLDEVRQLLKFAPETAAPFSTVGYRESLQYLKGEIGAAELAGLITTATRRLAKRQRTFWRNEPEKRGWRILPAEDDPSPVVISGDRASGSRGKAVTRGFRAFDLELRELLDRITRRLELPLSGVEIWHVALRRSEENQ